jgi:hypothetical protein
MEIEQLIWELNAKHYDQIRKFLQVVISPEDATMNPNLTANLRAEAELKAEIQQEQLTQIAEDLDTALRALKWGKFMAEMAKLNETQNPLYSAICAAFNSTQQAINYISDEPNTEKSTNQSAS